MGSFMKSKSDNWILNEWWSTGIPLGTPGGASGSVTHIGSATVYLFPSEGHLGEIGASTIITTGTVTVSTTVYASGDLAGTGGVLTFPNAGRTAGNTGVVQSVVLTDRAKLDKEFDLVIFNSNPDGTTFTDNAALDIADGDLNKIAGVITFDSYDDFNDNSVATVANVGIVYDLASTTTTLYGALVARTAATFVAITDVTVHLGLLRD